RRTATARCSSGATTSCGRRSRRRWSRSGRPAPSWASSCPVRSALRGLLPTDRLVALALLDGAPHERGRPGGIRLRALRELRRRAPDEAARRAVATPVQAGVAVHAVDLERAVRLDGAHRLPF